MKQLTIISLGWGVQSWLLAAMSALGKLPKVDYAIHSDTTWERQSTYEFATRWTPWLEERGVKVITVSDGMQAAKVTTAKTDIPAFSRYVRDTAGEGVNGQLRRQCTDRWKIKPIRRFISDVIAATHKPPHILHIRKLWGLENPIVAEAAIELIHTSRQGLSKTPGVVEQWLGITKDEWQRAKDADVKYVTHRYPLLEMGMDRAACLAWLEAHGLPSPGKSACVFCPYQNRRKWQQMKRENGDDWQVALAVDTAIRDKRPPYPLYVHPDRKPLSEAVSIPEDFGAVQISLLDELESNDADAECDSGHCFL